MPSFDNTCHQSATPGLQTYLDSLPPGSVFTSSPTACYLVPLGIVLRNPISIIGGTFMDPSTTQPTTGYAGMKPIILLKDTSNVSISGVTAIGANVLGGYHADLVGQAGIKLESTSNVSITGVTVKNTWGDGLELVADHASHNHQPVTGLTVDGFTTIEAGRQGITVAEVNGGVLNHVNVVSPADAGIDFESDVPLTGSGNVAITNCTNDKGFNIVEYLFAPVTISNCTGFHHVTLRSPVSSAPVSFIGGTLTCKRIDPQPCIDQTGGTLTFLNATIVRKAGPTRVTQALWSVDLGGKLTFVATPLQAASPFGALARAGTVIFVK